MPAVQSCFIEPLWDQFSALLPARPERHRLGCHRPRVPDRLVFDKLLQVLVFGAAYWRIADVGCSASTLRRRRDEWMALGVMAQLEALARIGYDRMIGLQLDDIAVDGCITKAPWTGPSRASNAPPWSTPRAFHSASSRRQRTRTIRRCWRRPWTLSPVSCSRPAR